MKDALSTSGKGQGSTIKDVAERAGVSMSTVSHVVNNTRYVSEELRGRVLTAMQELGYRPNSLARSLRRNRSLAIGVVAPDSSNPFFADIARGIEDACFDLGYTITVCSTDENVEKERVYLNSLIDRQIDGVVLIVARAQSQNVRVLLEHGIPTVVVDRDMPNLNVDSVLIDNYRGGYSVGEHLAAMGYQRPACIAGPYYSIPIQDRVRGYRDALRDHRIDLPDDLVEGGDFQYEGGRQAFERLCTRHPEIDSLFACTDRLAVGAMRAATEHGYVIPDQFGIVGFDNIDLAAYTTPSLTTVSQPKYQMGQQAAALLLRRLEQPDTPITSIRLGTRLEMRESTARRRNRDQGSGVRG
jgi:LacI family transcriptional regulator